VKYKSFDNRYGVSREDLFQVISYLSVYSTRYDIKSCGFIYPVRKGTTGKSVYSEKLKAFKDIDFYVFFLEVLDSGDDFGEERGGVC
jgi:5-methylcytosine-specific restriction enzyme subunit McrC